jgi:prepilin-type N-terminal cleavage/methylation domain-containing protein
MKRANGFTLVEMLVVIAVVGVLIGLLIPVLATARKNAAKSRCANNLEQMKRFLDTYIAEYDATMPETGGWMNRINPETGSGSEVFRCPSEDPNVAVTYSANENVMSPSSDNEIFLSQISGTTTTVFVCDGVKSSVDIDDNSNATTQANRERSQLRDSGTQADARTRHLGGANYVTLGGGVKYFVPEENNPGSNISDIGLKWDMY